MKKLKLPKDMPIEDKAYFITRHAIDSHLFPLMPKKRGRKTNEERAFKAKLEEKYGVNKKMERHCDPVTMDHIIELRKRVALLEKQLENALSYVKPMQDWMRAEGYVGTSVIKITADELLEIKSRRQNEKGEE